MQAVWMYGGRRVVLFVELPLPFFRSLFCQVEEADDVGFLDGLLHFVKFVSVQA